MAENHHEYPRMLGALLRIPFQAIVTKIEAGLRARGYTDLRPAHFVVFQHIRPEGSRITELAERAQMTKQSMSELVHYVEAKGYLEREPDPRDHRASIVRLSMKGEAVNNAAREIIRQVEEEWSNQIGREQMNALKQGLMAIIRVIEVENSNQ
ncbi:transcriptional regulators [Anaerolinea thermolimosa]|uniref:MarR family winged helix-turn-helix transcriptional regulator n=1 Tax=Anaerolinea thermolimosa TaxID=229919 RepID=UPI000783D9BB|nr:MarR family winged helix-turn-helix transcriptional regulator [Anaerolinea thermolimosa]GAP06684.1 transcriptional regulators [Anaerolinea thermolimosa]